MASQYTPIYPSVYRTPTVKFSTANTGRDGTGTLASIVTGVTGGTVVRKVFIKATGITTAGMVRFFIFDTSVNNIIFELDITAVGAPGATTKTFTGFWAPGDPDQDSLFGLQSGWILKCSTHNAEEFIAWAECEDYS